MFKRCSSTDSLPSLILLITIGRYLFRNLLDRQIHKLRDFKFICDKQRFTVKMSFLSFHMMILTKIISYLC